MSRADKLTRWVVSIHEAGHLLVGMLFDPEAVRSAQLTPDGRRGLALVPGGLSDRQAGFLLPRNGARMR